MENPKKRVASNGTRLPDPIREGEILTDVSKNQWRLGRSIGIGGFGEIYLASDNLTTPVGPDAQHVIKVESHKSGPLFVEMNFYVRAVKPDTVKIWCKKKRLKHLGLSSFLGFGSHTFKEEKYRFLVLDRFAQDLNKMFLHCSRKFHIKTVMYLGMQILDTLEYIHNHGYVHGDIKGSNLLLGHCKGLENQVYLLDFGLACRFVERDGKHKEYRYDRRKAHDGTIQFTSRDAHNGAHSRRGDLEILGYNMLQWLGGALPWEDSISNPEYVQLQKSNFMSNIPQLLKQCFPHSEPAAVLSQYLKYVAGLGYTTRPDYDFCKNLLRQWVIHCGFEDNGILEFNTIPKMAKNKKTTKRLKPIEEPENIEYLKLKKMYRNTIRQPCVAHNFNRMTRNSTTCPVLRSRQFNWEKVLSSDPEKNFKKRVPGRRKVVTPRANGESSHQHSEERELGNQLVIRESDFDDVSIPTPAMLEVMLKVKRRMSTSTHKKHWVDSRCSSPLGSPYPFPITPAMEQVLKRREELRQPEEFIINQQLQDLSAVNDMDNTRTTRSRANKRRLEKMVSTAELRMITITQKSQMGEPPGKKNKKQKKQKVPLSKFGVSCRRKNDMNG